MYTIHNFAPASKGFSFELSAYYDGELSRIYFEDFQANLGDHLIMLGDRQTDYIVVLPENVHKSDAHFKEWKLKKMLKSELLDLANKLNDHSHYCEEYYTKSDLINELINIDHESYYKSYFDSNHWLNLDYTFLVNGYCQGDTFKVNLVGKCESYLTETYFQNIFFDTPIYCNLTVFKDGEEYKNIDLSESSEMDMYSFWDEDDAFDVFEKLLQNESDDLKTAVTLFLKDNLPLTLDYI